MANPAELLLALFRSWHQPTHTADEARHPNDDGWAEHRLAVRHLDAIDQLLSEASVTRNVNVYRNYFPSWAASIFVYPHGWSRANSAQINTRSLEHLENLAEFLRSYVPELTPTGDADLRAYALEVQIAIESDSSVTADMRIHLRAVMSHLLWCLDHYEKVGAFEVEKAVEHLASTVLRTASNSADASRWETVVRAFVWPFTVNVVAAIPSQALAQFALGPGAS